MARRRETWCKLLNIQKDRQHNINKFRIQIDFSYWRVFSIRRSTVSGKHWSCVATPQPGNPTTFSIWAPTSSGAIVIRKSLIVSIQCNILFRTKISVYLLIQAYSDKFLSSIHSWLSVSRPSGNLLSLSLPPCASSLPCIMFNYTLHTARESLNSKFKWRPKRDDQWSGHLEIPYHHCRHVVRLLFWAVSIIHKCS